MIQKNEILIYSYKAVLVNPTLLQYNEHNEDSLRNSGTLNNTSQTK